MLYGFFLTRQALPLRNFKPCNHHKGQRKIYRTHSQTKNSIRFVTTTMLPIDLIDGKIRVILARQSHHVGYYNSRFYHQVTCRPFTVYLFLSMLMTMALPNALFGVSSLYPLQINHIPRAAGRYRPTPISTEVCSLDLSMHFVHQSLYSVLRQNNPRAICLSWGIRCFYYVLRTRMCIYRDSLTIKIYDLLQIVEQLRLKRWSVSGRDDSHWTNGT